MSKTRLNLCLYLSSQVMAYCLQVNMNALWRRSLVFLVRCLIVSVGRRFAKN